MLAYTTKTYYDYFWAVYNAYKNREKSNFIRVSGRERSKLIEFWNCLKAKNIYFSVDPDARKNKFFSFVMSFVKTHSLTVWSTGLILNYNPWKPVDKEFPTREDADRYIAEQLKDYRLDIYEAEPPAYKVEEKNGGACVYYKLNFKKNNQ